MLTHSIIRHCTRKR